MFNGRGEAHGLKDWQKRPIDPAEVKYWTSDRRLNMCVRTGPISGIYAFDIDIDDSGTVINVYLMIEKVIGSLAIRRRENSSKMLMMFRMEEPCKKRKIKLDANPKGPAIELLADGQQFVACGTHSSGVRYRWDPELPSNIPTITLAQLDSIWATLTTQYAKSDTSPDQTVKAKESSPSTATDPEVMKAINEEDWQHLLACLRFMLDKVSDNDSWSETGYALLSLQASGRPAEQLWLDFSRKAVGYEAGAAEAWWAAHRSQTTAYRLPSHLQHGATARHATSRLSRRLPASTRA